MEKRSFDGDVVGSHPLLFGFHPSVCSFYIKKVFEVRPSPLFSPPRALKPDPLHISSFFVVFTELLLFLSPKITRVHITALFSRKLVSTATRSERAPGGSPLTPSREFDAPVPPPSLSVLVADLDPQSSLVPRAWPALSCPCREQPLGAPSSSFSSSRSIRPRQRSV